MLTYFGEPASQRKKATIGYRERERERKGGVRDGGRDEITIKKP